MNKVTSSIIVILAAVSLVVGVVAYNKTPAQVVGSRGVPGPKGEQGIPGPQGPQGPRGLQGSTGQSSPVLGSLTSNEIVGTDEFTVNGVKHVYKNIRFNLVSGSSGTTTPCSFPISATSTLLKASINVTSGTSTAVSVLTLATSTTAFATTTAFDSIITGYSGQWNYTFTPTTTRTSTLGGPTKIIAGTLATTTWLNFGLQGEVTGQTMPAGGFAIGGVCKAELIAL